MKITFLNDNQPGKQCDGEHGLSILIEDEQKILFDLGPSDIAFKNAKKLGINLDNVDLTVLSHGHYDHGNGLEYIRGKKLICHPGSFVKRYRKRDDTYIGLPLPKTEIENRFDLVVTKEPYMISDNVIFLGEVPRLNDFEAKKSDWYLEDKQEDFVVDDSALIYKTDEGLVIFVGCSHSGVANIIEYAKKVTELNKIKAVIGGFHLREANDATRKTIEYFKSQDIASYYPGHCTYPEVRELMKTQLGSNDVYSGMSVLIN